MNFSNLFVLPKRLAQLTIIVYVRHNPEVHMDYIAEYINLLIVSKRSGSLIKPEP